MCVSCTAHFRHERLHTGLPGCGEEGLTVVKYYLVRVSEIGRYFFWLLLCDRACPVQPSAFFLSRVLLLGFGKLLSIKKKCHCRFVVTCVGFTTNCQNKSRSKSLPPDIHSLLFLHATTHTVALAGTCTSLVLFTMKLSSRHARSYSRTQSGVIQRLVQTRHGRRK